MQSFLREATTKRPFRPLAASAFFSAAFAPACGMMLDVQPSTSSGPCASDADCPSGEVCVAAACQAVCSSDSDCPAGELCFSYPDAQACGAALASLCRSNGDCVDGEACLTYPDGRRCGPPEDASRSEAGPDAGEASTADTKDTSLPGANDALDADAGEPSVTDATIADGAPNEDATDGGDAADGDAADAAVTTACVVPDCADGGCQWTTILFGGTDGVFVDGDTWLWTDAGWTKASPLDGGEIKRWSATGGAVCGQPWVYGGENSAFGGPFLNDVLSWNGTDWITRDDGGSDAGPVARTGASAVSVDGGVLLFGGLAATERGFFDPVDTWLWNGTAWIELHPVHSPPGRSSAAMATIGDQVVLFGGTDDVTFVARSDTWIWDGGDWSQPPVAHAPSGRSFSAAVGLDESIVLYGGIDDAGTYLGDTWTWDGADWTDRTGDAGPPALAEMAGARWNDQAVFFGGQDSTNDAAAGTWIWTRSTWQRSLSVGPVPRYGATMIAVQH